VPYSYDKDYTKDPEVRLPGWPSLDVPVPDKTGSTNLNIRRTQARPLPSCSISRDGGMNQSHLVRTISYGISSLEPVDDMSNMTPFLSMNSSAGFTYDMSE
jgi:hypothetical protein